MANATFQFLIDWFNEDLLSVGSFENGTVEEWVGAGTTPPTPSNSTDFARMGDRCMKIEWIAYNPFRFDVADAGFNEGRFGAFEFSNSAEAFIYGDDDFGFGLGRFAYDETSSPTVSDPYVKRLVKGLTVGREYVFEAFALSPTVDGITVHLGIDGVTATSADNVIVNSWTKLSLPFTATATEHTLTIAPTAPPTADGQLTYIDCVRVIANGCDVTNWVRTSSKTVETRYGRDSARSMDVIGPSDTTLILLNDEYRFTPDNPGSPLYGHIDPGKRVIILATFEDRTYGLFDGFLDDLNLDPSISSDSPHVEVKATDQLAAMAQQKVSTAVYPVVTTGQAINVILDEIKWPANMRDIDPGATPIYWWCVTDVEPLEAIRSVLDSEGMPSACYISEAGLFTFRDRHHRYIRARSQNVQASFSDQSGPEPRISEPFEYELGFSEVINSVEFSIETRRPTEKAVVWESEDTWHVPNGGTVKVRVEATSPFHNAQIPKKGTLQVVSSEGQTETIVVPEDASYQVGGVGTLAVTLSRTSGQTCDIILKAAGGDVIVQGMKLYANPIESTQSIVSKKDEDSIKVLKERAQENSVPFASAENAAAISEIIIGHRSRRLPTVTFDVINDDGMTGDRLRHQLGLRMSDRIHLTEPETFTDRDFYIEAVEQTIAAKGLVQTTTFGCEAVRDQVEPMLTFDDPTRGLDNGLFGYPGISVASTLFVLDETNLDEGLLGY